MVKLSRRLEQLLKDFKETSGTECWQGDQGRAEDAFEATKAREVAEEALRKYLSRKIRQSMCHNNINRRILT